MKTIKKTVLIILSIILIGYLYLLVKNRNVYKLSDMNYNILNYNDLPNCVQSFYAKYYKSSIYNRFELDEFIILSPNNHNNLEYYTNTIFTNGDILDYMFYGNTYNLKYRDKRLILDSIKYPSVYFNNRIYIPKYDRNDILKIYYKKMTYKEYKLDKIGNTPKLVIYKK